ncbi:Protein of unknown function [Bradyrhizobium sp. Gha]|nr:Protein of unknown function [Bradyrhizobium sp. Gha]
MDSELLDGRSPIIHSGNPRMLATLAVKKAVKKVGNSRKRVEKRLGR